MPSKNNRPPVKLDKLKNFYQDSKDRFHKTHSGASEWLTSRSIDVDDFRQKSQQLLAATSIAGSMIMNQPADVKLDQQQAPQERSKDDDLLAQINREEQELVLEKLNSIAQMAPGHIDGDEELYFEQQISDMLGFTVTAELEGHRLNHSIGIMGGEQHLFRYPTDSLENHDEYQSAGIAPARGAFGWFTENGELTADAIQREKYYFAVQTLYLPDWNSNYQELKPWYKFRKMVAINPAEQVAVVGVVGDAGPALWVKKQFGGSPEVIREGKIWSPKSRGRVILLFVDDPEDKIPLGPIDLSTQELQLAGVE